MVAPVLKSFQAQVSHMFFFCFFFAFCRYMKHLEILQDKNIDIQEMAK